MSISESLAIKRFGDVFGRYSIFFRSIATEVDAYPDVLTKYKEQDALQKLCTIRTLDAEQFFLLYQALAYGDIGVLFAAPRTCLSGILLQLIGTKDQQEYYFSKVAQFERSFFAVTEPLHGSDASQIQTEFVRSNAKPEIKIYGQKILVGNLAVADLGVIVGRLNPGPLGLASIMIKPEDFKRNQSNCSRETLPMFGIKPARLGLATFKAFNLPNDRLLGQEIKVAERGLHAVIKTFNIMRLGITGLALGHALAIVDYLSVLKRRYSVFEQNLLSEWQGEIDAINKLALLACQQNNKNPLLTSTISIVKVKASELVERIALQSIQFVGAACLIEHPFLSKCLRDCFGYEYMDGTSNIQRKNIYQGYLNGALL